ncbi:hypothetical protein CC79DRAFT_1324615 [Sarocladium strictum]
MFGTLHWDPRRKEAEFVKQPHATSHRERNSACDRCRLHKSPTLVSQDQQRHSLTKPPSPPATERACDTLAVEEFETSCNHGKRAELDSVISYQKKAVNCCRSMVDCISCTSQRENIVMFIFIVERIVAACSQVVQLYNTGEGAEPQSRTCLPTDTIISQTGGQLRAWHVEAGDTSPISTRTRSSSDATLSKWRELLVGDDEVNSQLEWEHLMRVLISVQLHTVMELLADTWKLRGAALTEMQGASLTRSGDSIAKLGSRMSVSY